MKISTRQLSVTTLGMFLVLVVGYSLLLTVILFREEINFILMPTESIAAEVEIASAQTIQSTNQNQQDYVQQILDRPDNFESPTSLLPAQAYLRGNGVKFLVGF